MGRYYRVGEVATLTRVSVRTLHHYDRIGLLRPALHSAGGYRLYGESELFRLQQILTLRYLGFPLQQIGELLDRADFDLVASLRVQRQVLHDRIAELERISSAISAWRPGSGPGSWSSRRHRRLAPV
jgi:DNA-binding transcriptional MerR regulator